MNEQKDKHNLKKGKYMFYKKSQDKFKEELFRNPTREYRGAPFWAWNNRLDKELMGREIGYFKDMGMGGAHIHCRIGLATPYLSDDFFQKVEFCEKKMKQEGLLCYLYDEDRWPSGSAGGIVTKDRKYRNRFLVFEPHGMNIKEEKAYMAAAKAVRSDDRILIGRYKVVIDADGNLKNYVRLDPAQTVVEDNKYNPDQQTSIWDAWLEISGNSPWFNNQAYVNTLDKKAIDRFVEVTHEQYYKRFGEDFGSEIPSIFSDEPQTCLKEVLDEPFQKKPIVMPFTDDFEETFQKRYGISFIDHLPELIWEQPNSEVSQIRYCYIRHVNERFSEAYGDNIGKWCEKHNIALTGHMMNEWTLQSQTMAVGDVMRPMKNFIMPGIDMLCDERELSTAKQAESVAHQMGREGVMSEIYGVTGWDFDFRNHKLAGDWQAALGVTLRVPHLTWMSMEGEGKRDYPASIGYQSPWYKNYSYIENHFARLNTALTRGKTAITVAVLHPIESYWLYWGNRRQTVPIRRVQEQHFEEIISWLLYGLIDFDFISEAMLAEEQEPQTGNSFIMGCMRYKVIVVPNCITIRKTTLQRLINFNKAGGKIIFMGQVPSFVNALPSSLPREFSKKCCNIDFNQASLLEALEPYRQVDVESYPVEGEDPSRMKFKDSGTRTSNMFYQLRDDGTEKWLFLCHVNKPVNVDITFTEKNIIRVRGEYQVVLYDTIRGIHKCVDVKYRNGWTVFEMYSSSHDSLLFRLFSKNTIVPRNGESDSIANMNFKWYHPTKALLLPEPESYMLEEKNCLLLDQAEYAFDEQPWNPVEELLKIDNIFRKKLGYPLRMEALAQPWTLQSVPKEKNMLHLRFHIQADEEIVKPELAMEHPENSTIWINGEKISNIDRGWYVDECIKRVPLPVIRKGENILNVDIPFGQQSNIEWMYILGDFGVRISGRHSVITKLPEKLFYGDYVQQNLGFYAGNLVYNVSFETMEGKLWIDISHYRGALLQVQLDNDPWQELVIAPYRINLGKVKAGKHLIHIRVFGNRANAFGPVHNADATERWYGPNLWRTNGVKWSYEYQLKPMGVLTTPIFWLE